MLCVLSFFKKSFKIINLNIITSNRATYGWVAETHVESCTWFVGCVGGDNDACQKHIAKWEMKMASCSQDRFRQNFNS